MIKDAAVDPGKSLDDVFKKHGWATFRGELEALFKATKLETLERNVRLLERICLAKPRKKDGWSELCETLANATVESLEAIDARKPSYDWRSSEVDRAEVLAGLARSLIATGQAKLLQRLVAHALAHPKKYPLEQRARAGPDQAGPLAQEAGQDGSCRPVSLDRCMPRTTGGAHGQPTARAHRLPPRAQPSSAPAETVAS